MISINPTKPSQTFSGGGESLRGPDTKLAMPAAETSAWASFAEPKRKATNAELQARRVAAVPRGVSNATTVYAERADNAYLWDVEGRRYIDFAGGIGVLNTGHKNPHVVRRVREQLERFTHTCFQVNPYESYVALAERLNALAPIAGPAKSVLFTTGAEAVENAVKIARAATGRSGVIAFQGGFHGRTLMALALTGKVAPYKKGFGPFPSEVYHAPFPNAYRGVSEADALEGLEAIFKNDIDPRRVAAIIIEPVQGEGGFNVAPPSFLQKLRQLCDEHGILLIADEVQSGFGRTGKMFAMEHSGVTPDLITTAKSLAGGLPLSGVIGRAAIMDAVDPGGLGGTYGGSPLACEAALGVLDAIAADDLLRRAQGLGAHLKRRLEGMKAEVPLIGEVRGLGAMVAVELTHPRTGEPATAQTKAVVQAALGEGLILLACGQDGNVLRFLVPLTAPTDVVDQGLDILERCLKSVG